MPSFAEKLKRLRDRADLTQEGLAVRAGLSIGIVRDYEQGKKEPSLRSAFKLADALGIALDTFRDCFGDDAPNRKTQRKGR